MSKIVDSVRLIFVDPVKNNNKFYNMDLYEDDRIEANWGRVGANGQFKTSHNGERGFKSTIRAKEKKGYVVQKTISETPTTKNVSDGSLNKLAKDQIKTTSTVAEKLIERLVKANIHQITSNTQISFNVDTGLFQTPLGIVTKEGIEEAKVLLDKMSSIKDKTCDTFLKHSGNYLKIIPQKVGRNVRSFIDSNFVKDADVEKQLDILDSLEVSLNAIDKVKSETVEENNEPVEKVFDLSVELLEDKAEWKRLEDNYYNSMKSMHHYGNVKVKNIYKVVIGDMDKDFDKDGIGNIEEFYHGTGIANCLSIMKSGLKVAPPSTAKIAGKMFGEGVYGAKCSTKSLGYSLGRWGQGRSNDGAWLFVCDFAMGVTDFVTSSWGKYPAKGYDSVTALSSKTSLANDEFIVYKNQQVNIKYLIECSVN